jgi:hypothetical protein
MSAPRFPWLYMMTCILSFVACTDKGDPPVGSLQPGGVPSNYNYMAYNSKGDLALNGTMKLTVIDSTSIAGTWSIVAVLPSEKVGPQVGTGKLTGTIQNSLVWINLNPGWVDNNVFLQGTLSSDRITGRWMWSTFIGPTADGTFEAMNVFTTQKTNN